jgi:hypothetical protein
LIGEQQSTGGLLRGQNADAVGVLVIRSP